LNAITGEHLQDLFRTEAWQDHFTTLADSLGFTLSIYSASGTPILTPPGPAHLCQTISSSSSEFKSQCAEHCLPFLMNALSTEKPDIFKCYAKIVSFALPVEYLQEKAVILGQGSFSSYEDFRECMNLVAAVGLEEISIKAPLAFTSYRQAWKACNFVSDSVSRLLKNSQETVTLRKKFESLKSIVGMWGSSSEEQPETLYNALLSRLSSLLDIDGIAVLVLEKKQERYVDIYSLSKGEEAAGEIIISERDAIVQDLIAGRPFVLSAEPVRDPGSDFLNGTGALYFFPIRISKRLEAIVRIDDRVLREGDLQIIAAFCRQTALSVENHRLHRELYKKFDRFATVSELTKSITAIQDSETLLRTILDISAELLKAEQGSLMLLDHETDDLFVEAKKGTAQGVTEKIRINRGEGIAGRVAELGEAILVENVEQDPRIMQKNRGHYKTASCVSVPLKIDGRIIGVLNLSDKMTGEVFDEEDLQLIQSFATQAAVVMERNVFYNKTEELKKLTITDPLTGLLNRRYLNDRLKDEVARSERHGHDLSLLMLDLDGFKYCNDTFGHSYGDRALKATGETLLDTVRSTDIVARYGGDEFMIILPETREAPAIEIAERLRSNVANQRECILRAAGEEPRIVTASIGIACYPAHGTTIEVLLDNVDKALYRAKNKGKNRIEVFS
jgi:diguanylate cyclase (GGDEF)-like protein